VPNVGFTGNLKLVRIPEQGDHLFRFKVISHSAAK